jgi:ribosomal-protein-alanine N-acetyltransferase
MEIRPITLQDTKRIHILHEEGFPEAKWSHEGLHDLLALKTTFGWGAFFKETCLGFIIAQVVEEEAEILTFLVQQKIRENGLGQSLYNTLETFLKNRQVLKIFLEVAKDNSRALKFYSKNGFLKISYRTGYYQKSGVSAGDAISMQKKIP